MSFPLRPKTDTIQSNAASERDSTVTGVQPGGHPLIRLSPRLMLVSISHDNRLINSAPVDDSGYFRQLGVSGHSRERSRHVRNADCTNSTTHLLRRPEPALKLLARFFGR